MSHESDTSVFSSPGSTCSHALCRMLWGKPKDTSVLLSGRSSAVPQPLAQDEKPFAEGGFVLYFKPYPGCHSVLELLVMCSFSPRQGSSLRQFTSLGPQNTHGSIPPAFPGGGGAALISGSQFHSTVQGCVYILPANLRASNTGLQ